MRKLYYGDNLDILRHYIPDKSVDLIYLDPPFNSKRNYNVIFDTSAQIMAFKDTWVWDRVAQEEFDYLIHHAPSKVSQIIDSFHRFMGENDMMAYTTMMTIRLCELHRVLKDTGSLYLHCDEVASHYLKIILDAIFGNNAFRNEIIWKKTNSPKAQTKEFGHQHDVILYYSKSTQFVFNPIYREYSEKQLQQFRYDDNDGRGKYQTVALLAGQSQKNGGRKVFTFRGIEGAWLYSLENLEKMWQEGRIHTTENGYRKKHYLNESAGDLVSDMWADDMVSPIQGAENLGYMTQKPRRLLERIIQCSSNENDVILDPFCGCGTAVDAAELLNRQWIGIDITHLAINLIERRMKDSYPNIEYEVVGIPKDFASAEKLAEMDKYQFQFWACNLIEARPPGNMEKKGADGGIDGLIYFYENEKKETGKIIISVKGGKNLNLSMIKDLITTVNHNNAQMGILLTLYEPTKNMLLEAVKAGQYILPFNNKKFPKIQIMTIKELLEGKKCDIPLLMLGPGINYKKSQRANKNKQKYLNI